MFHVGKIQPDLSSIASVSRQPIWKFSKSLWCLVFRNHLVADLLPPFRKPDSQEDAENLKVLRGFGAFVTVSNSLSFSQIKLSSQKEEEKCQYNSHGTILRFDSGYV